MDDERSVPRRNQSIGDGPADKPGPAKNDHSHNAAKRVDG
jgi:hypothetical protein